MPDAGERSAGRHPPCDCLSLRLTVPGSVAGGVHAHRDAAGPLRSRGGGPRGADRYPLRRPSLSAAAVQSTRHSCPCRGGNRTPVAKPSATMSGKPPPVSNATRLPGQACGRGSSAGSRECACRVACRGSARCRRGYRAVHCADRVRHPFNLNGASSRSAAVRPRRRLRRGALCRGHAIRFFVVFRDKSGQLIAYYSELNFDLPG